MRSNNRVAYRILVKDKKRYFKIGNIVIQKNEGDFYYIPSQRRIINSSFGLIQKIIDHFSFHKTGRVNVKPTEGGVFIVESGEGETQPLTNDLRQEIRDIGFQGILRDTIINVQKVLQQRKVSKLDVILDMGDYFGPIQFYFSIVSGRKIVDAFEGKETNIHPISVEQKKLLLDSSTRCLGFESDNADKLLQYQLYRFVGDTTSLPTGRKIFIEKNSGISRGD